MTISPTGLVVWIDPADELPIFRQIMRDVRAAIAAGRLRRGDQLPSHRDLAAQLVIAPLTVKKAYDELEREQLVHTRFGRGTFVSGEARARTALQRLRGLRVASTRLAQQTIATGLELEDAIEALREAWRKVEAERQQSTRSRAGE